MLVPAPLRRPVARLQSFDELHRRGSRGCNDGNDRGRQSHASLLTPHFSDLCHKLHATNLFSSGGDAFGHHHAATWLGSNGGCTKSDDHRVVMAKMPSLVAREYAQTCEHRLRFTFEPARVHVICKHAQLGRLHEDVVRM